MASTSKKQNGTTTIQIPATKLLSHFVATASTSQLTPAIRTKLKEVLIDYIACTVGALQNASSTKPIYDSILVLQGSPTAGTSTVIGHGEPHMLPQYAALLNSAFAHSLDFDDTYAAGTLHAGVTAISAAMTQAELLSVERTSEEFLLAVCIGYEITCRLGRELGTAAYSRGFHNTSTAGIFGAVAAISVLRGLSTGDVECAFGLAGSKAAGSMQYLDNGAWNKRLHPGFAVCDAFMCVALAEGGVEGATRGIEGKMGFLQGYSPSEADLERLVGGLGEEWCWLESSLKPYPACRMTHCFIEIGGKVCEEQKGVSVDMVRSVELSMPSASFLLVGEPTENKVHPKNAIDAQFSVYFQMANALLYGSTTGIQAYQKLEDLEIEALSDKMVVVVDPEMTEFAAAVKIQWMNGRVDEYQQQYPLGEVQHPFTRDKVDEKFHSLVDPVYGEKKAQNIIDIVYDLEGYSVDDVFLLLR